MGLDYLVIHSHHARGFLVLLRGNTERSTPGERVIHQSNCLVLALKVFHSNASPSLSGLLPYPLCSQ